MKFKAGDELYRLYYRLRGQIRTHTPTHVMSTYRQVFDNLADKYIEPAQIEQQWYQIYKQLGFLRSADVDKPKRPAVAKRVVKRPVRQRKPKQPPVSLFEPYKHKLEQLTATVIEQPVKRPQSVNQLAREQQENQRLKNIIEQWRVNTQQEDNL